MMTIRCTTFAALFGFAAITAGGSASAQSSLPPARPLGQIVRASTPQLGSVSTVRALANGNIVVNDIAGRRVVMFDSTLATMTTIADSTSATATAYSSRVGGLMAYHGDSTLFVDPTSMSMMVIDAKGAMGRVMSVPRPQDATFLIGGPFGYPGFDAQGRLVYRTIIRPLRLPPGPDGKMVMPEPVDSAPIIRFDLEVRKSDTAAYIKVAAPRMNVTQDGPRIMMTTTVNPLPLTDDWAILSDGSIALVRGKDYRVDWLNADGTITKGPKIPFEWQRLTDADKDAVIDSTRKAIEAQRARLQQSLSGTAPVAGGGSKTATGGEDRAVTMTFSTRDGGGGNGPPPSGSGPNTAMNMQVPPLQLVPASELPDYRPAFSTGAARGDADGNLWIRTSRFVNGGQVY
ncbi:MAG: hypothetical protein M3081_22165, partial [Gemmatimonadota bacterium]|nr:hypothetical protein [Gemmatimonadota bacterium]